HLFLEFEKTQSQNIFIPWTLEMGSWIWLKKNPMQLFSKTGLFNPVAPHRYQRTMRRHYILIEFFTRLAQNPITAWTKT
ncbi:MAG: zinc carboxypeptidase, partial [Bacteriovorax sp.]